MQASQDSSTASSFFSSLFSAREHVEPPHSGVPSGPHPPGAPQEAAPTASFSPAAGIPEGASGSPGRQRARLTELLVAPGRDLQDHPPDEEVQVAQEDERGRRGRPALVLRDQVVPLELPDLVRVLLDLLERVAGEARSTPVTRGGDAQRGDGGDAGRKAGAAPRGRAPRRV